MATIQSTLALQDKMSGTFSAINKAMGSTLKAIQSIKGVGLGAEFAQAAGDVKLAEAAIEELNRSLSETGDNTGITRQKTNILEFNAAMDNKP